MFIKSSLFLTLTLPNTFEIPQFKEPQKMMLQKYDSPTLNLDPFEKYKNDQMNKIFEMMMRDS